MSIKNFKVNISNCLKEIQNKNYAFSEAKKFTLVYILAFFLIISLIPSNDGSKSKSAKKPKDNKEQKVSKENYAYIGTIKCQNTSGGTFYYDITKQSIRHYLTVTKFGDSKPNTRWPLTQNKNGYVKWNDGNDFYEVKTGNFYMTFGAGVKPKVVQTCTP